MIFVLGIIGLATVIPLWMDYSRNPADNLLVRSGNDAVRDMQKVVTEITMATVAGQPEIFSDVPAWLRSLILWAVKIAFRMLQLSVKPIARS
jgi:hypothetical protein